MEEDSRKLERRGKVVGGRYSGVVVRVDENLVGLSFFFFFFLERWE